MPTSSVCLKAWTFLADWFLITPAAGAGSATSETKTLAARLADIEIEKPVFISGLPKSGGRILLEILTELPDVASHRNKDFPLLYTPYWSNRLFKSTKTGKSTQRVHRNAATNSPNSPEAMEEALWMSFFSGLHEPRESNVLNATTSNGSFEIFLY